MLSDFANREALGHVGMRERGRWVEFTLLRDELSALMGAYMNCRPSAIHDRPAIVYFYANSSSYNECSLVVERVRLKRLLGSEKGRKEVSTSRHI